MEAAISIIYSIPYNGINLNWTATTGNNGIISRGNSIKWNFDGNFLELYRLLLASIYAEYICMKSYFMLFPSQGRSIHIQ